MSNLSPKPFSFMPTRVTVMDRITIGSVHYRLHQERGGELTLETEGENSRFESFGQLEFYERHELGEVKIEEGYYNRHKKKIEAKPGLPFRSYSPKKRAKAKFYLELIKAYDELDRLAEKGVPRTVDDLGPHMQALALKALDVTRRILAGETVQGFRPPSVGHFNKMYRKFKDGGGKAQALVSGDDGPKRVREVDADSLAIWEQFAELYASAGKLSQRDVFESLVAHLIASNKDRPKGKNKLTVPTFKVFRGEIKKLGAYHVYNGRHGRAKADKKFGFSTGGFGFFRPGERVDIDEKEVDLMVLLEYGHIWDTLTDEEKEIVSRIRVWVVVAIDLATRYILAMRFCTAPNSQATVDVIRMMMEDKRELSNYVGALSQWVARCRPEMIYTDSGSGLVNDDTADILVECEIDHTRPTAGQPQARGHIESSFRTHRRVVRHFQGRTFKDINERGDYDSVKSASLPIDRFEQHYVRAILDVYHNSPHEGLGGETPHNAWVRQTQLYKLRPLIEPDVMRHIFGMDFIRRLDGHGLTFLGVPYHSPVLATMLLSEGQIDVPIRVNLANMASISFQKDGMWYVADNTIDLLPDVSVPEWMVVSKMVKQTFAESTALTLDVFYTALQELRDAGTAAALRNPLGLRKVTRDEVDAHERALLHKSGFIVRKALAAQLTLDAPAIRKGAFIGESVPGYNNIIAEVAAQREAEANEKTGKVTRQRAARAGKTVASSLGDANDIKL